MQKSILDHLYFDSPTSEQQTALLAMADFVKEDNKEDFLILCGAAGTGKTSITSALIGYLNEANTRYLIAAPTGRAARILGRKTNAQNSTIHSMIYLAKAAPETGVVNFCLKKDDEEAFTVFIVDEASMINATTHGEEGAMFVANDSLLNDLVKFVKSGNKNNKLILLGDRNQLPPVHEQDSCALIPDFLHSKYKWTGTAHLLTIVKRQQDGSYILKNAANICTAIEKGEQHCSINAPQHPFSQAVSNYVSDYRSMPADSVVSIGCTHNSNRYFNDMVRKRIYGNNVPLVIEGDLMLVTQKWSRNGLELYNGDHVTIQKIVLDKLETVTDLRFATVKLAAKGLDGKEYTIEDYLMLDSINFPSGSLPSAMERKLRQERNAKNKIYRESGKPEDDKYIGAIRLTYGHAITCNKAQGGEWEKVYMNSLFVPSLKWAYTAVTRAKTELVKY